MVNDHTMIMVNYYNNSMTMTFTNLITACISESTYGKPNTKRETVNCEPGELDSLRSDSTSDSEQQPWAMFGAVTGSSLSPKVDNPPLAELG